MKFLSFSLLIVFLLFWLIPLLNSQSLIMSISPNPVVRGDEITVDIFIDYEDITGVSIETPELPAGLSLSNGPYKRPYWVRLDDGSSRKKIQVTYRYSTNSTGRFVLGSYRVSVGTSTFVTDPEIIRIGLYRNHELYIPHSIQWSFSSGPFYEGQSIPLVFEVRDLEEVIIFEDVMISPPDRGFIELVKHPGLVSEEQYGDYSLYTVPVRGYLFTPSSSGKFKIPSASIFIHGITSVADLSYLTILEIPKQIKKTGAIGDFKLVYWLKNDKLSQNENIELHIVLEGIGNLNYLQLEEPTGEGLTLVNLFEISDYQPSIKGYTGSREIVYSFISDSPGDKTLIIPPFPFLVPESGDIITLSEKRIFLNIATDMLVESDNTIIDDFPFYPKKLHSRGFPTSIRYKNFLNYLWLLPGPLIFIFLLIGQKKTILSASIIFIAASGNMSNELLVDLAIQQYEIGEYEKAIELFTEVKEILPGNSNISYNMALAYYHLEDNGRSIYEARNAVYHDPSNSDYRALVHYLEEKREIPYPIELYSNLYPDVFLFLLLIFVNFAAFIGVIYLIKNKSIYFIISVVLLVFSILTTSGLVLSIIQKDRQVGVIIDDQIAVKQIPFSDADTVVTMMSGESVVVMGNSNEFLFIITGVGIKGWVDKAQLLLIKD